MCLLSTLLDDSVTLHVGYSGFQSGGVCMLLALLNDRVTLLTEHSGFQSGDVCMLLNDSVTLPYTLDIVDSSQVMCVCC